MIEVRHRGHLPEILITIALLGLILISTFLIGLDQTKDKHATILVFAGIFPVFAALIGSVLAYYFSSNNFAMAMNACTRLMSPAAGLPDMPVTAAMINKGKIAGIVTLAPPQTAADISIQNDLLPRLSPPVTRIPIVDAKGAITDIIHENTLHKFITKIAMNPGAGLTLAAATLQNLQDDSELGPLLKTFVIVAGGSTLAETKKKMDKMANCQDAFVTQTGKRGEPIIGWVTNARIAEFVKA